MKIILKDFDETGKLVGTYLEKIVPPEEGWIVEARYWFGEQPGPYTQEVFFVETRKEACDLRDEVSECFPIVQVSVRIRERKRNVRPYISP
jgi:hypothetical protein